MDTLTDKVDEILARLRTNEAGLQELHTERAAKEWYGTAEIASLLNRSDYTIREWCRKKQIPAEKTANGRDWIVSHETLIRLKNRELPLPEYPVSRFIQRRRA
jgi:excisionase family DNA binding protein